MPFVKAAALQSDVVSAASMIFFMLGWIKSFDTGHALAKPARMIDLDFLRERLGRFTPACPAALRCRSG